MPDSPAASIVIPTRERPRYLDVALRSVAPQAAQAGAEVIVVSDGPDAATAALAARHDVTLISLARRSGANAARNAGVDAARGELVVFIDDDIAAPPGWLHSILDGAAATPAHDAYGGPITASLEGGGPRGCGRERPLITTLDYGPRDRDVSLVWSANMAVRRAALDRIGPFDESLVGCGEEEDWLRRCTAAGGLVRYLSRAGVEHRRTAGDATLRALARSAYSRGRAARRYDEHRGEPPPRTRELRILAGCAWHTLRRRCANGIVLGAHSAGRLREALATIADGRGPSRVTGDSAAEDFLSGTSGHVAGIRATGRAIIFDAVADAVAATRLQSLRLARAAEAAPPRRVLALAIERTDLPNLLVQARAELLASRHDVRFASAVAGARGKFENLAALLTEDPVRGCDWLVVIDDDVALPRGFLDQFLFLAERFDLRLAQPAHRHRSHAAWPITRRRTGSVVRETAFVEIGPVFAFHASTFDVLLPFPPLRAGWGLELHWSALARQRGWKQGIVDATPVCHGLRPIAATYDRQGAVEEARQFLSDKPYTRAGDAKRTLATHRSWR